jgi:hypothetical protein
LVSLSSVSKRRVLLVAGLAVAGLLLWGGYVSHWRWTGFHRHATLWDWLEVLMLPIAFGGIVVAGCTLHWRWTGFQGNTLFDWLHLLVAPLLLPLVVVPAAGSCLAKKVEHDSA